MSETSGTTPNELLKESAIVVINSKSACQLNQVRLTHISLYHFTAHLGMCGMVPML